VTRAICLPAAAILALAGSMAQAATPPGYITFATVGNADPNGKVPVLNGVPGSGVSNIALPVPQHFINHGDFYNVAIGSQNGTFKGTCITSYNLSIKVGGKPKIISSSKTKPYACGPETFWIWDFNTPAIPDNPGAATLAVAVSYGSTVVHATVPLIIQ
jgi:hypothetical protein